MSRVRSPRCPPTFPRSLSRMLLRVLAAVPLLALSASIAEVAAQNAVASASPSTTAPVSTSSEVRVGDRLVMTVDDQEALTDTFTVTAGPAVHLPGIGHVPLTGVTRTGIAAHLTTALAKVIRNPVVRVELLVRLAVVGEVARPGFMTLPSDALLSDAITMAGGLTAAADLGKVKVSRRGELTHDGDDVRDALAKGQTLDDLRIEAGDEIRIPQRRDNERIVRILGLLVAIPLTVFALMRM